MMEFLDKYLDEVNNRTQSGEIETDMAPDWIVNHAYMLTQYMPHHPISADRLNELYDYIVKEIYPDIGINEINYYLEENFRYDEMIYENSEDSFAEMFEGRPAWWIACRVKYGDWSPADDYVRFDGYGNLESVNEWALKDEYEREVKYFLVEGGDYEADSEVAKIIDNAEIIIEVANQMVKDGF